MEAETTSFDIAKRLDALSKWHDEYRILLSSKHEQQRAMLETREGIASQTMQTIDILYKDQNVHEHEDSHENSEKNLSGIIVLDDTPQKLSTGQLSKPTSGYASAAENKLGETDSSQSFAKTNTESNTSNLMAPRKFLRKGEGLKQRFKIEPDAFNLKKLPPYKYAKSHPKLATKHKPHKVIRREKSVKIVGEPEVIEHISMPPSKLDAHEVHFQRLLFASKTICNSTPESKGSSVVSLDKLQSDTQKSICIQQTSGNTLDTQSQKSLSLDMAWSKVLDPFNIKPISVTKLRTEMELTEESLNDTEDEHLNLFELLEEKAKEGSFNFNSSLIKQILSKNLVKHTDDDKNSDIIPITAQVRQAHIVPRVDKSQISSSSESEAENDEDESNDSCSDGDESADADEDENETTKTEQPTLVDSNANDSEQKTASCLRVRFVEDDRSQTSSKQFNDTSAFVDNTAVFEQMKSLVLAALAKTENSTCDAISSTPPFNAAEIKQLAEQGRQRVAELEQQIALFKETNLQLIKAKQQHELEKVCFMQQQEEALEQINDEKIKIEIQLHDERMQLEEERRKLEEKSRIQKANVHNQERREIIKLKEEIVTLQNKLRDKEQTHTAAQARLRSQLRVLEKEQKHLYEEIERLNKEKRKLEKQMAQHTRERNTTMLQEINRNIVKLAGSSKMNTNSNVSNEKTSVIAKNDEKQVITSKKSLTKKVDKSYEPLKALKITANSFSNLLPKQAVEKLEDKQDLSDDDTQLEDATSSQRSKLEQALEFSPTAEKENSAKTSASCFKVLTREITSADGGKEIIYPNGTIRKESGDGLTVRMMYFNGDVKETNVKEGTIKYYYSKTNTWHTTYLDGLEIIEFPNGQIEHRLPSGVIEVHYPHKNCIKVMNPKDEEKAAEYIYEDGATICEMRNGNKLLTLPNGQKELTTKEFKRREYPDGTVKTVYPDGSHETRYSNGRLRLKDKDGNLIIDTDQQDNSSNH